MGKKENQDFLSLIKNTKYVGASSAALQTPSLSYVVGVTPVPAAERCHLTLTSPVAAEP